MHLRDILFLMFRWHWRKDSILLMTMLNDQMISIEKLINLTVFISKALAKCFVPSSPIMLY